LCFIKVKLSVKVKLFVSLLCVCAILPAKAVPEMTYTVSGGTWNPTHSLTHLRVHGNEYTQAETVSDLSISVAKQRRVTKSQHTLRVVVQFNIDLHRTRAPSKRNGRAQIGVIKCYYPLLSGTEHRYTGTALAIQAGNRRTSDSSQKEAALLSLPNVLNELSQWLCCYNTATTIICYLWSHVIYHY